MARKAKSTANPKSEAENLPRAGTRTRRQHKAEATEAQTARQQPAVETTSIASSLEASGNSLPASADRSAESEDNRLLLLRYIDTLGDQRNHLLSYTSADSSSQSVDKPSLNLQHIQATAQYLQTKATLLDLVTVQLAQYLVESYSAKLSQQAKASGQKLAEGTLPYLEVVAETGKSPTLKTNLDRAVVFSQIKNFVSDIFEKNRLWEESAKEVWSNIVVWAIQDMQAELGESNSDALDPEAFNQTLCRYLFDQESAIVSSRITRLEEFYSQTIVEKIVRELDLPSYPLAALEELLGLQPELIEKPVPPTEVQLSQIDTIAAIPTGLPIVSSISAQLQTELWKPDDQGIAHFRYRSKNNQNNYLEHYITSPGDIETLPWEAAEQIINKFGFNTVKLQFILAAYAMRQAKPWESTFTLKASDIIQELGWDRNHNTDLPTKRNEVASIAYALSCLLVKAVWIEGRGRNKVDASTPVGRMWEVLIDAHGQFNWLTGRIDKPDEVYITVRPGLWTAHFLNQAGSKAKEALYQFGYLALNILTLDPYHDELTLRLAIHLTLDVRIRARDRNPYEYRVKTLLEAVLPETVTQQAKQNSEKARSLFDRWNHALKLLATLGWHAQDDSSPENECSSVSTFYMPPCPEWLAPDSKTRKPKGWVNQWLEQKLMIKPPQPIPQRMVSLTNPKAASLKKLENAPARKLTGEDIKTARKAKKWTQAKLAGTLAVHQSLIAKIESGDRLISPELEPLIRQVLDL